MAMLYLGITIDGYIETGHIGLNAPWDLLNPFITLVCGICTLASVDFLFCFAQKKFNNSMFAIAIALLVLMAFRFPFTLWPLDLFYNLIVSPPVNNVVLARRILWFLAEEITFLLAFIGLAVAYIVVKSKFLKSLTADEETSVN